MKEDIFKPTNLEVMQAIWDQSEGNKVFLPTLVNDIWGEGEGVHRRIVEPNFFDDPLVDYYFSPLRYDGKRQRQFVGNPGVIYADLDGNHREDYGDMPPSIAIYSGTPGHYHAYWFLDHPVDPLLWEAYAKGWTQEIGADPAGWDITQVLRVPGTFNQKTGNKVEVVSFRPERKYSLGKFPKAKLFPAFERQKRPAVDISVRGTLLGPDFDDGRVPLTARYWLTVTPKELQALGKIDRSAIMWGVEKSLISSGYTIEETYQLMYHSAINKWKYEPEKLWTEIIKAAS